MFLELSKLKTLASYLEEASRGVKKETFYSWDKQKQDDYCKKHPESRYAQKADERNERRSIRESEKLSKAQRDLNKDAKDDRDYKHMKWAKDEVDAEPSEGKFKKEDLIKDMRNGIVKITFTKEKGEVVTRFATLDQKEVDKEQADYAKKKAEKQADPNYKPRKTKVLTEEEKAERAKKKAESPYIDFIDLGEELGNPRGRWRKCRADMVTYCKPVKAEDVTPNEHKASA